MNYCVSNNTGIIFSFVDLVLIVVMFIYFNRRMSNIENSSGINLTKTSSINDYNNTKLNERVISLENDIDILLKRLNCYDEIIGKILSRLKESNLSPEILGSIPSNKSISIKSRLNESLLSRKEPFVDNNDTISVNSDDGEFGMFSFLN